MGDNGGPHIDNDPAPSRWDATYIERNWPFRGQKHEIFEGGVRVAGFVYSPLLPAAAVGSANAAMIHVTDWAPTILNLAKAAALPNTDGFDVWACLGGSAAKCARTEMVLNIDLTCDTPPTPHPPPGPPAPPGECLKSCADSSTCDCHCYCTVCNGCGEGCYDTCAKNRTSTCKSGCTNTLASLPPPPPPPPRNYDTECPAPKAGIRVGDHKLLVECYDGATQAISGKVVLFDLSADPQEANDISAANPGLVKRLADRVVFYGKQAVTPMGDSPPWQGPDYYCAKCRPGKPVSKGSFKAWEPWCDTGTGLPCP